ncbi:MAG: response regulator [Verrucomicrobiales bacterium]|nr:response regulator [Verrucomicrobiales bacterium]MCP5558060.1 response regulator [Verrucomicrobiaceae bacterium]
MKTQNHRILVVDDNPTIHEDFRKVLSPVDAYEAALASAEALLFGKERVRSSSLPPFDLTFATQGEEAARLVQQAVKNDQPFALAFVDMRMPPGWDGIQTIEALWKIQPELQVVICTAYAEYSWEDIAARLGVSHRLVILKKPFDPIELMQLAHAMTAKWAFERDMILREFELMGHVQERTRRIDEVRQSLVSEQAQRQRLEAGIVEIQKMEAVGGLAAGMAHDFNNILTVIQGHLSVALLEAGLQPNVAQSLEEVMGAAKRAAELTRQLLAFSKRELLQPRPLRIEEAVDAEIQMLRRTLGEAISIEVAHQPNLPMAMADPGCLGQIVVNLAINARDAMPRGGRLSIMTRLVRVPDAAAAQRLHPLAKPGDFVQLSVVDTGEGMTSEVLEHVFEPFFTTKGEGRGTGMGLAMVQSLVQNHGGWIEVESQLGTGTEFRLHFPKAEAPAVQAPPAARAPVEGGGGKQQPATVLVVDDDAAVRQIITHALRHQGHTVLSAEDASEAWKLWCSHSRVIKLVITDITMPGGVSGLDLGRVVTEEDATVPIIYTSGYSPDVLGQAGELIPGKNYLAKPFDLHDLVRAVDISLRAAPTMQRNRASLLAEPALAG